MSQNIKPLEKKVLMLYNGSLQELNLRNSNDQYQFGEHPSFTSDFYPYADVNLWTHQIGEKLRAKGYDGLVNERRFYRDIYSQDAPPKLFVSVEGTPIMRVR